MKFLFLYLFLLTVMTFAQPAVYYKLSMPNPDSHLFEVEVRIEHHNGKTLDLHMPAWRTGRYMILDFAGGVQEFSAVDAKNKVLPFKKMTKDTWRIENGPSSSVTVRYKVFANEFNMRTRELNSEHAFVDPLSVFMYMDERKNSPLELTVIPYRDWKVTTGLEEVSGRPFTFSAPNFEYFGDCPLEIGNQHDFDFFVDGKKHTISIYGDGNWNSDTLITDLTKIVIANKEFWGELPYKKYVFMIHCQPNAGGGTEHINSTIMGVRPFVFSNPGTYKGFLGLVSHEYFHTWNVKQLRPKAIAPYDFSKENYAEEFWVSEGTTSYFDDLILLRTGHSDAKSYLEIINSMVNNERARFGNTIQPLAEASFDAWIKYWRGRQNSQNAESDYYGKGSQVSLVLDLEIRQRSKNKHSLEEVMRIMFKRFPLTKGFTNNDLKAVCEEVTGGSFADFFTKYLYTTAPLPWEVTLQYAGLEVTAKDSVKRVALGVSTIDAGEKTRITNVTPNSPGAAAGLDYNDEIVALNGYRVRTADLNERIASMRSGDEVTLTIFRNDKLKTIKVILGYFGASTYTVKKTAKPSELQRSIYEDWLKEPWSGKQ
ncbi:MAG: M61 family metallopeptidase [Bacteroidota bacterium]